MKAKLTLRSILLAAGSSFLAVSSASAQTTYTWDINTPGSVVGGTGAWNTSNSLWTTDAGATNTSWVNAAGTPKNDAVFGGTAGTVTLGEAISIRNLTINSLYTITGQSLNFTSGTITVPNGTSTTVGAIIESNITGAPAVNAAALGSDRAFIFRPVAGGSMNIGAITGAANNSAGIIRFEGAAGSNGTVASSTGVGGTTSGPKAFFSGSGTWTVTGDVWSRNVDINSGTVVVSTGTLRHDARSISLNGGTLHMNNAAAIRAGVATGGDTAFRIRGGSIDNTSNAAITTSTWNPGMNWEANWTFIGSNGAASDLFLGNGNVVLTGTRQVSVTNAATTLTVGGVISGSTFGVTKAGAGAMLLSGNSIYTGATTVVGGSLITGGDVASTTVAGSSVTADAGTEFITLAGNTLVDGNKISFGGTTAPGGLTAGTTYFVRETSGNNFKVSATQGGAAINITSTGTAVTTTRFGVLGSTNSAIVLGTAATTVGDAPALLMNGAFTNERAITVGTGATSAYNATIGGTHTTGTSTYSGNITLTAGGSYTTTLRAATGGTVEFKTGTWTTNNKAIAIGSSGNTGTVLLSNALTTSGGVSVNHGTLSLGNTLTVTGGTLAIGTAGTLSSTSSGTVTGNATLTGSGIINLNSASSISGTLSVTGGNWNGNGAVTGLVTSSSGTFTIGNGANLTANGNLNVTGGSIVAGNSSSTITGSVDYSSSTGSTFAGVIAGASKTLTKSGASTLILSGANSYTGATNINGGKISVSLLNDGGNNSGIGASSNVAANLVFDTGTLEYTGAGNTSTDRDFTIKAGGATITRTGDGVLTWAGNVAYDVVNQARTLNLQGSSTNGFNNFSGTLSDNGTEKLTVNNNGSWILSGTNTYTGDTTVASGTLAINGSITSDVIVQSGATLQGSGSIAGSVTVDGTLAAGNSIESLATGALILNGTSTFAYEIQTNLYAGTPNVSADLTDSSGTLDIAAGAILTITDLAASTSLAPGSKLTLISYMGGWTGGELFTYLGNTLADNSILTLGSNQWFFDYNDTTGGVNFASQQIGNSSFVTMTVIPETSTALLSGLGALALLRRRRKSE